MTTTAGRAATGCFSPRPSPHRYARRCRSASALPTRGTRPGHDLGQRMGVARVPIRLRRKGLGILVQPSLAPHLGHGQAQRLVGHCRDIDTQGAGVIECLRIERQGCLALGLGAYDSLLKIPTRYTAVIEPSNFRSGKPPPRWQCDPDHLGDRSGRRDGLAVSDTIKSSALDLNPRVTYSHDMLRHTGGSPPAHKRLTKRDFNPCGWQGSRKENNGLRGEVEVSSDPYRRSQNLQDVG